MDLATPGRWLLRAMLPVDAFLVGGCPMVPPGPQPSASPSLDVNVLDNISGVRTDITGARSSPTPSNPYQYSGLWTQPASETQFDAEIGIHAHDPTGVHQLIIAFQFYTCAGPSLLQLRSFNNGATTGVSQFTLTATPGPPNGNQAPTDLAFPIRITTADLQSVVCPNGQKSSGVGTIEMTVNASNFSTNPSTQTTLAVFDLQLDSSPIPQPPLAGG